MGKVLSCIGPIIEAIVEERAKQPRMTTKPPPRNIPKPAPYPTQQHHSEIAALGRPAAHLRPPNEFEEILLLASQSMAARERAVVEKLVIDFRSSKDRQITAEEQQICLRVMQQFQTETSHMTNMATAAAQRTQQMSAGVVQGMNGLESQSHANAGSVGGLRQTIFDQGMAAENARQVATQARMNNMLMMQYDPEASGYNQTVRMHNQNVLDQVWATNHGQRFTY